MKALAIIAIVLGAGATGASLYAKIETYPNYKSFSEMTGGGALDRMLLESYSSTLDMLHLAAWVAGGIGLILAIIALAKAKGKALPAIGAVVSLAGGALSLLSMQHM